MPAHAHVATTSCCTSASQNRASAACVSQSLHRPTAPNTSAVHAAEILHMAGMTRHTNPTDGIASETLFSLAPVRSRAELMRWLELYVGHPAQNFALAEWHVQAVSHSLCNPCALQCTPHPPRPQPRADLGFSSHAAVGAMSVVRPKQP